MDFYTRTCAALLFPLHERIKGHASVRLRRELEQSQWWAVSELQALQVDRLRMFLSDIGQRVPYYRTMFQRVGFEPHKIERVSDLHRLPRLGKAEIRAGNEQLKAVNARGLTRYSTGGSSGEPLTFFTSIGRRSHDVAAKWRATRWWGVDIGDPEIVVWGSPVELGAQDRIRGWRDQVLRSWLLPAFDMSEASLDRYVAIIRSRRPAMLFGYPSSLSLIATHARKRRIRLDTLGIKVAFVTSERLYEHQRETIREVFGAPVANGYGGRDSGFIAHECPLGRMHISAEDIIVEIVRDDGAYADIGESGEIVVTHMATADYPFVRYRTGDVGRLDADACPCGRGLPVLKEIQGRNTDFVVASDGTVIHGLALIYVIRELDGIERFKIIQHDRSRTEVLIEPGEGYQAGCVARIRAEFKRRLGASVEVAVNEVTEIPREASGKYRYVVSNARSVAEVDREKTHERPWLNASTKVR